MNEEISTEATTEQFNQFRKEVEKCANIEATLVRANSYEMNLLKFKNPQDLRSYSKIKEIADKYEVLARIPQEIGSY